MRSSKSKMFTLIELLGVIAGIVITTNNCIIVN